jgi:hypothetical protein
MTVQSYDQYYKTINNDCKVRSALAGVINYDRKCDAQEGATIYYNRNIFVIPAT